MVHSVVLSVPKYVIRFSMFCFCLAHVSECRGAWHSFVGVSGISEDLRADDDLSGTAAISEDLWADDELRGTAAINEDLRADDELSGTATITVFVILAAWSIVVLSLII